MALATTPTAVATAGAKNVLFPSAIPFSYVDPGANGHAVMVSMFPQAVADSFGSGDIDIEFVSVDWPATADRMIPFMPPVQPVAATNPDIAASASYLKLASSMATMAALCLY